MSFVPEKSHFCFPPPIFKLVNSLSPFWPMTDASIVMFSFWPVFNLTRLSIHPAHPIWQIWSMAPFHQFIKIGQLNSPNSPDLSNFPNSPTLGVGLPIKIKVFGSVLDFDLECLSHSLCPCFACFPFCFLLTVYYLLFSICLVCCFEFMQFESETACLPNWHSERRRTKLSLKFKLYFLLRYFYIFLFEMFIS